MGKIIVAIPYFECDPGKREVLKKCLASLRGQDEIIVVATAKVSPPGLEYVP